jgi:hypothetical protein
MQTPHTALIALRPIGSRPAPPAASGQFTLAQCPQGRELWSRCFLRPICAAGVAPMHRWCWASLCQSAPVSASLCQRAAVPLVAAPGFHRLWPCPLPLALGPDASPETSPDAPDASERPAWPCLTDALDACRPHGPVQPRLLGGWRSWLASAVLQSLSVLLLASGGGSRRLCPVVCPPKSHVSLPTWDTAQRVVYAALGFSHSQAPLGAARRDIDGLAARLKQRADCSEAPPHQRDHSCLEHREVC